MSDVEFFEPVPEPPAEPGVGAGHDAGRRRLVSGAVALALAVAGAALAVVAPFRAAYRLKVRGIADNGPFGFALDGWGRYHAGPLTAVDVRQHGPRFGIVYCAAAAVVVIGIVLSLAWPRGRRAGSALVVFAGGAVLASAAAVLLNAQAAHDGFRSDLGARAGANLSLQFGGLLWLSVASTVLLIAAVVVRALGTDHPVATRPPEPSTEAADHVPPHRDDELLG